MELLTNNNLGLVVTQDAVAPLTNPLGPPPVGSALSAASATAAAGGQATVGPAIVGEDDAKAAMSVKNVLFLGLVSFFIYKYGRKYFV